MVSIDRPLNSLHFRIIFNFFLKDPGPLKSKKRITAVQQLSLGQVSIMWRPLQKNSIAVCPNFDYSSLAVEDNVNL
jgi:hypothetical protein